MRFAEGQKVVVHPSPSEWVDGAVESLEGLVGVVEEVKVEDGMMRVRCERYLVMFPERPRAWSANQIPSHSWWFEARELEDAS